MRAARFGCAMLLGAALLAGCADRQEATPMEYPPARREARVTVYHEVPVSDPYRWLETDSPETQAWVTAQNRLTASRLRELPQGEVFARRLRELLQIEHVGVAQHRNGRYVFRYSAGTDEQDSLHISRDPAGPGSVLVDGGGLREEGHAAIGGHRLSPDGTLLAWSRSDDGSDWRSWRVRDVATGEDSATVLHGIKFSPVAWTRDSRGFFYSRYPGNEADGYDDQRQLSIYYHRLGTAQARDTLIYSVADHPTRDPYPRVTEDGRYLLIELFDGHTANAVYYQRLTRTPARGRVIRLLDAWDGRYEFAGSTERTFYFRTTAGAPRGRVIAIDLDRPAPADWRVVVPESDAVIQSALLVGGRLVIARLVDVRSQLSVYDLAGQFLHEIELPGEGSVTDLSGEASRPELLFSHADFRTPPGIWRHDVHTGATEPIWMPAPPPGLDEILVEQVFFTSADGTRVPMSILRRSDTPLDGNRPTVLSAYGGFNLALLPRWSAGPLAWALAGGIYAEANLRGGGEYGEEWHRAGMRHSRQRVFEDYVAAAEWLIDHGYTRPERLAARGASNGGLLVGAVLNQRPGLFAAALPAVGLMDMLRYHLASANAFHWSSEYGLSDDPDDFPVLYGYSPYHNIRPGRCYPATLVLADAHDDRVPPWHSYKYAAALQHAQDCDNPVLIRIDARGGHGAGIARSRLIEAWADQWAFLAEALQLPVADDARPEAAP